MNAMVNGKKARELNDVTRYTMWSVFKADRVLGEGPRRGVSGEV